MIKSGINTATYFLCCNKIFLIVLLTFLNSAEAKVKIIQLNQRFTLIQVDAKYVKAILLKPIEGLSIYGLETKDLPINFNFTSRRANPWEEALYVTLKAREIIRKSKTITILGARLMKYSDKEYDASWEYISGEGGCITYFTEDKCPGDYKEELEFRSKNPIDYTMFPELFEKSYSK